MSIKLGTLPLAGIAQETKINAHSLFDFKWTDHILNEMSWLRGDTFSWQSGSIYVAAYNHLAADYGGATQKTETIGSYTITYYEAQDGHKIILPAMETTAINIYNETGVAWYYILDTTNQRFKLPRTKFGFTGYRDSVGKYVGAGLPDLDGWTAYGCNPGIGGNSGVFYENSSTTSSYGGSGQYNYIRAHFKASAYNSIYGASSTVQPPATQMYLYFYVGEFSQSATEQTAGLNSSLFNGKIDLNGNNAGFVHIVETYSNGTDWYKIYSNGWCEQGGTATVNANSQYNGTFLTEFKDTNICFYAVDNESALNGGAYGYQQGCGASSKSAFYLRTAYDSAIQYSWFACGFVS